MLVSGTGPPGYFEDWLGQYDNPWGRYDKTMTDMEYIADYEITKEPQYVTATCELWSDFYEYFGENKNVRTVDDEVRLYMLNFSAISSGKLEFFSWQIVNFY